MKLLDKSKTHRLNRLSLFYREDPEKSFSLVDRLPLEVPFWKQPELGLDISMSGVSRVLGYPTALRVTQINPAFPCDSGCFLFEPYSGETVLTRKFMKRSKKGQTKYELSETQKGFQLEALALNLFSRLRDLRGPKKINNGLSIHTPSVEIFENVNLEKEERLPEGVYEDDYCCTIAMDFVNNNAVGEAGFVSVGEEIQAIAKIKQLIYMKLGDSPLTKQLHEKCDNKLEDILISVANANSNLRVRLQHMLSLDPSKRSIHYSKAIAKLFARIEQSMYVDNYNQVKSNNLWQLRTIAKMCFGGDENWVNRVSNLQELMLKRKSNSSRFVMGTRDYYLHDAGIFEEGGKILTYILDFDKLGLESLSLDFARIFLDWRLDLKLDKRLKLLTKALNYELSLYGKVVKGYKGALLDAFVYKELSSYVNDFLILGVDVIQHSLAINYNAKLERPQDYERFSEIPAHRYVGQLVKRGGFVDQINGEFKKQRYEEINKREIEISSAQTKESLEKSLKPQLSDLLLTVANGGILNSKFSEEDQINARRIFAEFRAKGVLK